MLSVEGATIHYGGLCAVDDLSVEVGTGEAVSIIGPNGAGKTTLLKSISGTVPLTSGRMTFDGHDLLAVRPSARAHLGIAHVPQGRRVFASMSVQENLELGALGRPAGEGRLSEVFELFPVLANRRQQAAGTLSGGEQQMLAIGRGLMSSPRLLLLDEPSMGLAPAITDEILERIVAIHKAEEVTVVLVEQRATEALEISQRTYVLETGRVVLNGPSEELRNNDLVRRAYLGM